MVKDLTWRPPESLTTPQPKSPPRVILSESKDLVRIRHRQNRCPTQGDHYAPKRFARPVHSRVDGLSSPGVGRSPWGGLANAGIARANLEYLNY
jgi:hypothetical protein